MKSKLIQVPIFLAVVLTSILVPMHYCNAQIITTIAGGVGGFGYNGDGIPATSAQLSEPTSSFVDINGNIYIAETWGNRLRRISPTGQISTLAGDGTVAISGDGGPATAAQIMYPSSVVVDRIGNIYIASAMAFDAVCRIRKIDTSGIITNFAGNDTLGYSGDGGPATDAKISASYLAVDRYGNIYFPQDNSIREIDTAGIIRTIAGVSGTPAYDGDGGQASAAHLFDPLAVSVNAHGTIAIIDHHGIRKIDTSGIITTVAGSVMSYGFGGDGGPATAALFNYPSSLTLDNAGNIFVADRLNYRVRMVNASGVVTTIAGMNYYLFGSYKGDGMPATTAKLNLPTGVSLDTIGNVYFTDCGNARLRKIEPSGIINTVAGTATPGFSGDGGGAMSAQLYTPQGLSFDSSGDLFFADPNNARIRRISPSGVITTVAGDGVFAYSADGLAATAAHIGTAYSVYADRSGNLYFYDGYAYIRKVNSSGIISTIAGTGVSGFSGDGGQATAAKISEIRDMTMDGTGNIYFADLYNYVVRKITPSGIITTVAGNGINGFSGDGGAATAAKMGIVSACILDVYGNLYISDWGNHRIRKVNPAGIISTIAGTAAYGYSGDGGPATAAQIDYFVSGLACDSIGNLFLAEYNNERIRKIDTAGIISTIAGIGVAGNTGNGGPAVHAQTTGPAHLAFDRSGSLYFSDGNCLIRKIGPCSLPDAGVVAGPDSVCAGSTITLTDTVAGGIWVSGNTTLATISSTGVVAGVSPGIVNVYYVVNNSCGTDTTVFPVTIRTSGSCVSGIGVAGSKSYSLNAYPSPSHGSFTINITSAMSESAHVIITDILGQKNNEFFASTNKEVEVRLNLTPGIYFVSASMHGALMNTKIVIE